MLGVSALRENIHGQYTDSSITVIQQYYECYWDKWQKEWDGKGDIARVRDDCEPGVGPFQPFIVAGLPLSLYYRSLL